ncbi:MAG: dihydrodipicolinate synthase family protein [Anaerolineaceae bacterium]|nr:dihydrodipicolinate synthase family protein [Anaerolineaceae bacterium]
MSDTIRGIFNILATPFDEDAEVDVASLKNLVNFQIDKGAYGLTILGVLGEAAKLSINERKLVMDTVVDTVDGRVPIVVGTSHADLETCIALSQAAFANGAQGVMIAPPRMDNPTDDAVLALYSAIAEKIDGAIVVQDFPPVNGVIMSPDFLARLAEEVPNARHLKLEDPPLMQKITAIRERTDKYAIFGGLGGMFLLEELARGASGTMTGFAFTEILVAIFDLYTAGQQADAQAIFDHYLPLIRYENQPQINLTIRKELLWRRGAIAYGSPREPFNPIDSGTHQEITWLLERVSISDPTQRIII